MHGLIFYSVLHSENSQWAIFHVNSKTYLALRYLSQEKKKVAFSLVKTGLGPMKAVRLVSLREMCGQNLIVLS